MTNAPKPRHAVSAAASIVVRPVPPAMKPRRWPAIAAFYGLSVTNIVLLCSRFPRLYLDNEMWAEAASNFFATTLWGPPRDMLLKLDFGYVPLLPRLLALVGKFAQVPVAWIPSYYAATVLLCIAGCNSVFALPAYRRLMASDSLRAVVCLGLMLHPNFDLKTFTNVAYSLAVPALLFYFDAPWRRFGGRTTALISAGMALAVLSKPHFITLLPVALALILLGLRRHVPKGVALVGGMTMLAGCVQLAVMCAHTEIVAGVRANHGPAEIFAIMANLSQTALAATFGSWRFARCASISVAAGLAGIAGAALLALISTYVLDRRRPRRVRLQMAWLTALAGSVAGGGLAMNAVTHPQLFASHLGDLSAAPLSIRHFFVPTLALYLAGAVALMRVGGRWSGVALCALLTVSYPFGLHTPGKDPGWPQIGVSSWRVFAPKLAHGAASRGCVMADPYPWLLKRDCRTLLELSDLASVPSLPSRPVAGSCVAAPEAAAGSWQVETIALFLRGDGGKADVSQDRAVQVVARNAAGKEVARTTGFMLPQRPITFLQFAPDVRDIARLCFEAPHDVELVMREGTPVWGWFGTSPS